MLINVIDKSTVTLIGSGEENSPQGNAGIWNTFENHTCLIFHPIGKDYKGVLS